MNAWQMAGLGVVAMLVYAWWKIRATRRGREWSARRYLAGENRSLKSPPPSTPGGDR